MSERAMRAIAEALADAIREADLKGIGWSYDPESPDLADDCGRVISALEARGYRIVSIESLRARPGPITAG